ncbi:MAG TPA: hypothetical protein VKX49_06150 [Bryobacteraceae bacterium]|nr:hypothetical protein [Bryobacteraceae bacterium]
MKEQRKQSWAKWRDLISEQQQHGKSIAGLCGERGLREWQFHEWKKRLRETQASQFLELRVRPAAESRQPAAVLPIISPISLSGQQIEIRLNRGRSLVVGPGFDAQHLRALPVILESET